MLGLRVLGVASRRFLQRGTVSRVQFSSYSMGRRELLKPQRPLLGKRCIHSLLLEREVVPLVVSPFSKRFLVRFFFLFLFLDSIFPKIHWRNCQSIFPLGDRRNTESRQPQGSFLSFSFLFFLFLSFFFLFLSFFFLFFLVLSFSFFFFLSICPSPFSTVFPRNSVDA